MFNFVHDYKVHTHILNGELGNKFLSYTQINMVFVTHNDVQNVECQLLPITNSSLLQINTRHLIPAMMG